MQVAQIYEDEFNELNALYELGELTLEEYNFHLDKLNEWVSEQEKFKGANPH